MSETSNTRQVAMAIGLLLAPAFAHAASSYKFQTINNNGDAAFNQLLGINTAGTIAGYFGDGATVPNNGYTVTPPYGQGNFTAENFTGAAQTQVIGINNSNVTVGFYADAVGDNFGFVKNGATFTTVSNPSTPTTSPFVNQLLGVNDHNVSAGFYVDSTGTAHAYLYNIGTASFTAINPTGATASTATGVNNAGNVSGFLTLGNGNTEGFFYNGTNFTEFEAPGSTNTMFFGLNNNGLVVGTYVDANGLTNGIVYDVNNGTWWTVDAPNVAANTTFNVNGTFINGINDAGSLVGFYSNSTAVNGFLATVTPEPSSVGLVGFAVVLGAGVFRRLKVRKA
jgi:hypothetical protein